MATPAPNVLNFTGERFAPEVTGAIWYEHWHRYCVAQPLAKGLSVLDAACGEGYGSFLLAQTAKEVVGIDIATEAIAHARSRYVAPNLRYVEGSCTALPMADASFDLIVSFETIEHLQQQREMLTEFRRVLVPGGVLILSSPNPPVYGEKLQSRNEYHVRELTREELAGLLTPLFPHQKWYGQRVVAHSALWVEDPPRGRDTSLIELINDEVQLPIEPAPPMYFLVVCSAKNVKLPQLPALSLFDDGKQSLYNDYTRALLREKELYWQELDARKIAEDRLGELITVTNDLASARQQASALSNRLVPLEDAYDSVKAELETERQYTAALTWEERNGRAIAEGRLNELITAVNNLSSERDRAEALSARVDALEEVRRALETELTDERQKRAAAEWEQRNAESIAEERLNQLVTAVNTEPQRVTILEWDVRNAQSIADERLKELIAVTNELARERDKSAGLAEEVTALRQAHDTARVEVAEERQRFAELQWEERNARSVAEDRLKEAIATANNLAHERDKATRLSEELNGLQKLCDTARIELERERQNVVGLEWEERNQRSIADERLKEAIATAHHLAHEQDKAKSLAEELSALQKLSDTARTELERERQKVVGLEWEERNQRTIADERLKEAVRVANEVTAEREKVAQLAKELQAAGEARVKAEIDLNLERQKIAGLEWEERDARKVAEQRLTELIEAVNAVASEREKSSALLGRVTSLEASVETLQGAFAAKHRELDASQSALAAAGAETEAVRSQFETMYRNFEQQIGAMQNAHAVLQQAHTELAAELVNTRAALENAGTELVNVRAALENIQGELSNTRDELSNTRDELSNTRDELSNTRDELSNTRAELSNTRAELEATRANARAQLDNTEAELAAAHWQVDHFEKSANATRADLASMQGRLAAVQSHLDEYKSELAVARAQFHGSQADLAEVEADLARQEWVLADVQSRLSFRDSVQGWLRWPLARIKAGFRSAG